MKLYVITAMVIGVSIVVYYAFITVPSKIDESLKQSVQVEGSFVRNIEDKVDRLTDSVEQLIQNHSERFEQSKSEQVRLNSALASLEERLQMVELKGVPNHENVMDVGYAAQDKNTKTFENSNNDSETAVVSERELSQWMEDTINTGYLDDVATSLAAEQVEANIVNHPELDLVDVLCSQRFCRASFLNNKGGATDVSELIGVPPFVNEGFTITEPDGRVTVYFTDTGISLSELQEEVRTSRLGVE
jgi:hypothetical protein